MSWLYSRALVACLEGNCSDGEPSAPLNSTHTPQAYSSKDKMTDFSRPSLFGMTFGHLTDNLGEALLTWYREVFLARTFPSPERELESTVSKVVYGGKWRVSLVKYDPDTCSWKIPHCLFTGDLAEYLETWPKWGTMRNGVCWGRNTPERFTSGIESGLWLTPCAMDANPVTGGNLYRTSSGSVRHMRPDGRSSNRGLEAQVMFPTPTVQDSKNNGSASQMNRNTLPLNAVVKLCGTPRASDGMKNKLRTLSSDHNCRGRLEDQVAQAQGAGAYLNPDWVELLMGWPKGWTNLEPLKSAEFRGWGDGWEADTPRVAKDILARAARIKAIGNGQVPQCAALAWRTLQNNFREEDKRQ